MPTLQRELIAIVLLTVVAAVVIHGHVYNPGRGQENTTIQSFSRSLNENITNLGGPVGVIEYEGKNLLVLHASGPWIWIAADIAEDYGYKVKDVESEVDTRSPPETIVVMERSR